MPLRSSPYALARNDPTGIPVWRETRGAYPDDPERSKIFLYHTCFQVYIDKGIELVEYNIYIIRPYPGRHNRESFSTICTGLGLELSFLSRKLYGIKMPCYFFHPVLVTYEYNGIRDMFGFEVQVIYTTIRVEYKFGFCYALAHGIKIENKKKDDKALLAVLTHYMIFVVFSLPLPCACHETLSALWEVTASKAFRYPRDIKNCICVFPRGKYHPVL